MLFKSAILLASAFALSASALPCGSTAPAPATPVAPVATPSLAAPSSAPPAKSSAPPALSSALPALSSAPPAQTPAAPAQSVAPSAGGAITADTILSITPATKSCATAEFPNECADAARAGPAISASFAKYEITEKGTQAALIAIMMFESGSFVYNKNHYPGRPGQGTKNMQMPDNNKLYAAALFPDKIAGATTPEAVLQLVSGDNESFGSAAWHLTTQCGPEIQKGLAAGDAKGWDAYLTGCVKTTHTPDRDVLWTAAKKVLGV
ncbi:hypothetical protein BDV95DRAFT_577128 [Massariosphaeria phaeospora]|uniref:Uncharacterized protein n=1 Tax=Massariosphaeria phaeospora TaxID=100035 RepID=A0A7C8IAM7_9PLEO|nr:hypothetical protein BDV95DRAFT_577128 [Massariosphaeria phaeospora]